MFHRFLISCILLFPFVILAHENDANPSPSHSLPLQFPFVENLGQWHRNAQFRVELGENVIFFERNAFHYQFNHYPDFHAGNTPNDTFVRRHVFKARFLNANPIEQLAKESPSEYYFNYFIGNDKTKWKGNVHAFETIEYPNLYNGINLKVYQRSGRIKYDYIVQANHSPEQIRVRYEGVERPSLVNGNLIISHSLGQLIEERPFAYQEINGQQYHVPCNYRIDEEGNISFHFPEGYNREHTLIIDPVLVFSTYSGSIADNFGQTATYDRLGSGYLGGIARGNGYLTTLGAFQTTHNGGNWDIALTKFSPDGTQQIYSTYIGGARNETVHSIVVDDSLNLYLLGASSSTNYPTTANAHDRTKEVSIDFRTNIQVNFIQGSDIILTKFSADGTQLMGSTFFGGNNADGINLNPDRNFSTLNYNYGDSHRGEIVIDTSGFCYIGTSTNSTGLSNMSNLSGQQDGIVAKFTTNLDSLVWARYVGGSDRDAIYSLKVIDSGRILLGGGTISYTDFPITPGVHQEIASQGAADGFIAILSADGTTIERSTFIGTSSYDQVYFIDFDRFDKVYGYGQSRGGLFPVKNAPVADTATGAGQFIVKLDVNLDSIELATTFGDGIDTGAINISPTAFLVDRCQNIYAAGWGSSLVPNQEGAKTLTNAMPVVNAVAPNTTTDGNDFYLYVINRDADSILYASYFGGSTSDDHVDGGTSRFDKDGIVYHSVCASCGPSTNDFPTTPDAFSRTDNSPNCNNALFKFDFQILINASFQLSDAEICLSPGSIDSVTITNTSVGSTNTSYIFSGDTIESNFRDTVIFFSQPGTFNVSQIVFDSICAVGDFLTLTVTVRPDDIDLQPRFDPLVCFSDSTTITALTGGNANQFEFSTTADFSTLINPNLGDSTLKVRLNAGVNRFFIRASNPITNACEKVESIEIVYFPSDVDATISANSICQGIPIQFNASIQNVDTFLWRFGDGMTSTELNPSYTYPNFGNFQAFFVFENETCGDRDSIQFNITVFNNDLSLSLPEDTLFCGTGTFNFSANASGSTNRYIYSSNRNFSDTLNPNILINNLSFNSNDSALFFVQISNGFCSLEDSIVIEYVEYELALPPIVDSICTPFLVPLNPTIVGVDSFRILLNSQTLTTSNEMPSINFDTPGQFTIQLLGSNAKCGISETLSIQTNVFEGVQIQPIVDETICLGDTISITANTMGTASNFILDNTPNFQSPIQISADSTINLQPNLTTAYYLRAENTFCNATTSFTIETEIVDIEVNGFISFCIEDTIQIEAIINLSSNQLSFEWNPSDSILNGANESIITISPNSSLSYFVEATSTTGCKDFDTIEVNVNLPAFSDAEILVDDDSLFKGQIAQLSTNRNGNNLRYNWEPINDVDNPTSPTPRTQPDSSTIYKVSITDLNTTCTVEAFRRLAVFEINCGEPDIFIPTAFTPNQDLRNDVLYVRGSNIGSIDFQLFNRWGELVFETTDINVGWDGTFRGKAVNPGVFVYQLRAVCLDGQQYFTKGNITLIR